MYIEAAAAYKKRYVRGQTKYPASYLKLVFPTGGDFAFFIEGDYNTTFQNINGYGGRAVFGIQFGNWLRPSQYGTTTGPVPVDVPRPHYELLAR
ncbi:MAG: hypothetical protein JO022_18825 [Acidobacteriaceae bacterium]|nr:hypothetical protein [Acidobacteriaceae bacterium]